MISGRLNPIVDAVIAENQNGFRKGRSCTDSVFTLKMIIEKRREFNLETHIAFVDYEKAFDRVKRPKLWEIMSKKGIPQHLIQVIKGLYDGTRICIDTGHSIGRNYATTNQGVRQGCSLSTALFNLYLDDMLMEWNRQARTNGICIGRDICVNSLLFADDQALLAETEDDLQYNVHTLGKIAKTYNCRISTSKTEIMAFRGNYPVRSKICIDNIMLKQTSRFNYLGNNVSYDCDRDVQLKLARYQLMCGTIRRTLGRKTRKETQLKFYKTMALPTLLYGSENWVLRRADESSIQSAEMKFLRAVKGCTRRDHIRNDAIREELGVTPVLTQIHNYKKRWAEHLQRMDNNRLPKLAWTYRPRGRRSIGRPRKRWSVEPEQANGPIP